MKQLVKHLVASNLDRIAERSLWNCHAKGLHSIMLLESPGQTIRLYVARPGNKLYRNNPQSLQERMSIGFHPHHCDITIHCVCGTLYNINLVERTDGYRQNIFEQSLDKFIYRSEITGGGQGFEIAKKSTPVQVLAPNHISAGESIFLTASTIHTVYADPFSLTAWLVYEGKEDKNYQSIIYSNDDLTTLSTEGFYQKMDKDMIVLLLKETGLLD